MYVHDSDNERKVNEDHKKNVGYVSDLLKTFIRFQFVCEIDDSNAYC